MASVVEMTSIIAKAPGDETIDLRGMRVLVVGMARTGIAVARFLASRGAQVVGTDARRREDLEREFPEIGNLQIDLRLGGHEESPFSQADMIILSPGVPPAIPPLVQARNRGIRIISEIELAFLFVKAPIVAVTGTNGKTTTTLLIGAMLEKAGNQVFVGGNIGTPLINLVDVEGQMDFAVVELSSFQLEGIETFRPAIAVLLNLAEDHLDRYDSFNAYVEAKSRLFLNQTPSDVCILNAGDPTVRKAACTSAARKVYFNIRCNETEGTCYDGRYIILQGMDGRETYDPRESFLKGIHNVENMMAAIVTARLSGCSKEHIQGTLAAFKGLPHRLETVAKYGGVTYVNDSKATNVSAAKKSLESFPGSVILIAGGKDKGGDYAPLRGIIRERVKHLILMGEARQRMTHILAGAAPMISAESLEVAVREAQALARPGDTVLLSPACSSFDMFRDYVERGKTFKDLVRKQP